MMSRKNYREFADMLATRREYADSRAEHLVIDYITQDMAVIFRSDNSNFSRERFFDAAGYNSNAAEAARVEPTEAPSTPHLVSRGAW